MRKWLAAMMVAALIFGMCGCSVDVEIQGDQTESETSSESAIQPEQEQTQPVLTDVYGDENCVIRFYNIEKKDDQVEVRFRVSNLTGRTLTFQSDCIAFNGESFCDVIMSDEVAPDSDGTILLRVRDPEAGDLDPAGITSLSGNFTIIDFNDDNFHDGRQSYRVRYGNVQLPGEDSFVWDREPGAPLYEDEKVSVSYLKAGVEDEETEVWFRVKNKTEETVTIQGASLSVNGESASDLIASEAVAPGAIGNIRIRCKMDPVFADVSNVTALTGALRVIAFDVEDFHDGAQSYEISFAMGEAPGEGKSGNPVQTAYEEMLGLSAQDLTQAGNGGYRYKGLTVFDGDYAVIGGMLVVNQGAMYGCAANFLELYCELDGMLYGNGPAELCEMLLGTEKPATWKDFEPTARKLYTFIFPDATERDILKAFECLAQVEGSFDYDARTYAFAVSDLSGAAREMGISERMLGYVLAKLSEYAPEITFGDNSLEFSLSVKSYG